MSSLGKRIRQLRKERKLTLADVADGKLTKGMLSLIENGKAQPSMESLQHIASQLSVDIAQLVGNENLEEIRGLLEQVESTWKTATIFDIEQAAEVCDLIEPFLSNIPDTYEGAKVLQIYVEALYIKEGSNVNQDEIEPLIQAGATIYKKIHLNDEYVKTRVFSALMSFRDHLYSDALKGILEIRNEIEEKGWRVTEITNLELMYYEAVLYFAVGDYGMGKKKTDEALEFIKESKIYYLVEEFYRLAIFIEMISGNSAGWKHYQKKMQQYADFTESAYAIWHSKYMSVHYYTNYTHEYEKALQMIEECDKGNYDFNELEQNIVEGFLLGEKGIALYGLKQYKDALETLDKWVPATYLHHPFDLSVEYQLYAYKALCNLELGNQKEAEKVITKVVELIDLMPPTPYKDFILAANEKIRQAIS